MKVPKVEISDVFDQSIFFLKKYKLITDFIKFIVTFEFENHFEFQNKIIYVRKPLRARKVRL